MGLAASQARMLSLTARRSDLEFQGQQINQERIKLASATEEVADDYTDALSNRKLMIIQTNSNGSESQVKLTYSNLTSAGYTLKVNSGTDNVTTLSAVQIEAGLRSGKYTLMMGDEEVDYRNESESRITDILDTSDDATAEAKYSAESAKLQTQDRALELQLKNVDTQHSAMQTEMDAVKKVIDKNIESSFKTFNA